MGWAPLDTAEEAALAYDEAARRIRGEAAITNFRPGEAPPLPHAPTPGLDYLHGALPSGCPLLGMSPLPAAMQALTCVQVFIEQQNDGILYESQSQWRMRVPPWQHMGLHGPERFHLRPQGQGRSRTRRARAAGTRAPCPAEPSRQRAHPRQRPSTTSRWLRTWLPALCMRWRLRRPAAAPARTRQPRLMRSQAAALRHARLLPEQQSAALRLYTASCAARVHHSVLHVSPASGTESWWHVTDHSRRT